MDIRALAYIRIESTDVEKWREFGTNILGMMVAPGMMSDGELYLKMDEYSYRYCILPGEQDRFLCAGWEVPGEAAFRQAQEELSAQGISWTEGSSEDARQRNVRGYICLQDPGGQQLEICYNPRLDYEPVVSAAGVSGFETGYHGDMGLGHIAMQTPCLEETHRFYTQVLGFGQTDYMHFHFNPEPADPGQGLHFLHANNPRHHSLALYEDSQSHPGNLVHLMAEVNSLDDFGRFLDRIHEAGTKVITAMGRHTNDKMVSAYVESPAGFALEYGFDGVQIDWQNYTPTESSTTSHWGHRWNQG
jgi:3,4-dihydroxy-9,10-secoandrosta-1,3,5(10)-triene-9,17-dione 4,5-dioxygenase